MVERKYIGLRYVPIIGRLGESSAEWDNTKPYEPLTVVLHNGNSYTSRQFVPVGIDIANTDFWALTGNYNAQVESYRRLTNEVASDVEQIQDSLPIDDFSPNSTVKEYIDNSDATLNTNLRDSLVPYPDPLHYPKFGTNGQVLTTHADGTTEWVNPVVPSDAQAEIVITEWLDNHPEATTTVADNSVTNAKLNTNSIKSRTLGMNATSETRFVTYKPSTKTLTLPAGTTFVNGHFVAFQANTLVIPDDAFQSGMSALWISGANNAIYAQKFGQYNKTDNDRLVGYVYNNNVYISGIPQNQIKILDSDDNEIEPYNINPIGFYSTVKIVTFDSVNRVLTIPDNGFVTINGSTTIPINAEQVIDVSSIEISSSAKLFITKAGVIYATAYSAIPTNHSDAFIGCIQRNAVRLNGYNNALIHSVWASPAQNNEISQLNTDDWFIGIDHTRKVSYNYSTKILTIPAGFSVFNGRSISRAASTLDLTDKLTSDACVLVMQDDGSIEAIKYNAYYRKSNSTHAIGYIYKENVVIAGIHESQVTIESSANSNYVYCFGDSITAGVGATNIYHMLWHSWLKNYHFKNYGIGSTGYCVEAIGTYLVGGGVEGRGTNQEVSGANTIKQVMQSVADTMTNITISAGTNDWSRDIPASTFRAAVQDTLDYALSRGMNVFVMTPIRRQRGTEPVTNAVNMTVEDYGDIIIEECVARGIPYCNGYDVGINPANATNASNFTIDGLHANNNGQARMARNYYNRLLECLEI